MEIVKKSTPEVSSILDCLIHKIDLTRIWAVLRYAGVLVKWMLELIIDKSVVTVIHEYSNKIDAK